MGNVQQYRITIGHCWIQQCNTIAEMVGISFKEKHCRMTKKFGNAVLLQRKIKPIKLEILSIVGNVKHVRSYTLTSAGKCWKISA